MTRLSFIALFFYVGALFPVTQLSAEHRGLDTLQHNPVLAFSLFTSSAQPIKHIDCGGDSDQALVQWHSLAIPLVALVESPFVVSLVDTTTALIFSARAPPVHLC